MIPRFVVNTAKNQPFDEPPEFKAVRTRPADCILRVRWLE